MAAINFRDAFDTYVAAHQKVWLHDRTKSIGASEAFGCIRKAWFGKNATVKDADYEESWGALQRGDLIEQHFVEPAIGWFMETQTPRAKLVYGGKRQRTFIDEASQLSATPDGLITGLDDDALALYGIPSLGGSGCVNFEIKSIDPRVNLKEEKGIHRGQVQVQMGLTREKTRFKPNFAVICYIDASFFDDLDIFIVEYDEHTYQTAKARARTIYKTKNPADLLPEGKIDETCRYCPYKRACSLASGLATPTKGESNENDLPPELVEEFQELVAAERALSSDKKGFETDHKDASERLKAWFRDIGVRRVVAGGYKASISWVKGRKTLDLEAMRADGIDVDKYYVQGNGYDMLRISEQGPAIAEKEPED